MHVQHCIEVVRKMRIIRYTVHERHCIEVVRKMPIN